MSVHNLFVSSRASLLLLAKLHIDHIVEKIVLIDGGGFVSGLLDLLELVGFFLSSLGVKEVLGSVFVSESTSEFHSAVGVMAGPNDQT